MTARTLEEIVFEASQGAPADAGLGLDDVTKASGALAIGSPIDVRFVYRQEAGVTHFWLELRDA